MCFDSNCETLECSSVHSTTIDFETDCVAHGSTVGTNCLAHRSTIGYTIDFETNCLADDGAIASHSEPFQLPIRPVYMFLLQWFILLW